MSKTTPGPWTYDSHGGCFYVWGGGDARAHLMVADGDPDEGYITRMRGVGRGATVQEQEANARLIAAAPELLEAAILARNSSRCTVAEADRNPEVHYINECGCAFHTLNRAVKKAGAR